MLDGATLPINASIMDFRGGTAGYMANAMEKALLLSKDMKRYLVMVCPLLNPFSFLLLLLLLLFNLSFFPW